MAASEGYHKFYLRRQEYSVRRKLNVLIVEDSIEDAELMAAELERQGYDLSWKRVETAESMDETLRNNDWNIIISDFSMPRFSAMEALKIAGKTAPEIPFIVVSGTVGEEIAVETVRNGAHDYIMKDKLQRLAPAVTRELKQADSLRQKKQAEARLKESEERYQALFERSLDIVFLHDFEGRFIDANPAALNLLGYDKNEITSLTFNALLDDDDQLKKASDALNELKNTGRQKMLTEFWLKTKQGHKVCVETKSSTVFSRGEPVAIQGVGRDITERKRHEAALDYHAHILAHINDSVVASDLNRNITYWNEASERLYGWKSEQVIGKKIDDIITIDMEAQRRNQLNMLIKKNGNWRGEAVHFTRKNKKIMVDWSITKIYDAKNNEIGTVSIAHDITEKRQTEEDKSNLQKQLLRAQKLETIGTLAGGIAHDFNNILTPILGYADMASAKLPDYHPVNKDLKEIVRAANRAKDLVQQILTFSRNTAKEKQPLRLQSIVKEALKLLRSSIPSTIEIRQEIETDCPKIFADASQMHQIIVNLCVNAAQAMELKGGIMDIELSSVNVDDKTAQRYPNLKKQNYVRLAVSDNGCGMNEDTLSRIFEPFFTTKEVDKGTGMGLSVVHGIVKTHHGEIIAESGPGKGSKFAVYLPVTVEDESPEILESVEVDTGTESLLIVDDEKVVAMMLKKLLEQLGYAANVETESKKALDRLKANPAQYDLVLTDLTMPGMTGLELAREIKKVRADLPILLMTGYGDSIAEDATQYNIKRILGKPINRKELAAMLRIILVDK